MQRAIARWLPALFAIFLLQANAGADSTQTSTSKDHIAIQGYDVVSYFTDGKPAKGDAAHQVAFDDVNWWFKDAAHQAMFTADPERYLPQYGGFCAGGLAMGVSVPANPDNWVIVDGKLYMVSGTKQDLAEWKAHATENIKAADKIWADHSFR